MKTPCSILTAVCALAAVLTGCATDPLTGRQTLSPEMQAAANRVGISALNAAEAAITARLNAQLRIPPSGK